MNDSQKSLPLSERVPVEETLDCIRFIEQDRNIESVRQYVESVMPFGEKASLSTEADSLSVLLKLKETI